MPKLLPERQKFKRQLHQHVKFKDPLTNKEEEIKYSTVYEGKDIGCPVIEVGGRMVMFELKELAYNAIVFLRKEGLRESRREVLSKTEKERIEKGLTGFSPVKEE